MVIESRVRSVDEALESTPIDMNKFYYLGFSGGASAILTMIGGALITP